MSCFSRLNNHLEVLGCVELEPCLSLCVILNDNEYRLGCPGLRLYEGFDTVDIWECGKRGSREGCDISCLVVLSCWFVVED